MTQEALKLALEALELVNMEFVCNGAHHAKKDRHELGDDCPVTTRYQQAITAIKKALAQTEQEPVAWMDIDEKGFGYGLRYWSEPDNRHEVPLYTAPPQRKPLTKDRTMEIANQTAGQYWMDEAHIQRFRAAVEADHGIQE